MTPAVRTARAAGIRFELMEYQHDARAESYGLEAATALGLPTEQVLKTLVVNLDRRRLAVALVPVGRTLDLKAVADATGAKRAAMADAASAERATGYVVGGISPLGQRTVLPTVIDESVLRHHQVYVSGGRRGLELALSPADLLALCRATTWPLAR